VLTVFAGDDESDIELQPSATSTQVSIDSPSAGNSTILTVLVKTLSGPTEMVMTNYTGPKFRYYISLENTAM